MEGKNARFRRVTHDLSNLLGVILGNVDLALPDLPADHPAAESLREIQQAARDARTICRQMRDSLHEAISEPAVPAVSASPKCFILIDDDEAFRVLFERSLLKLGHKVRTFASPGAALEAFQENPCGFNFVITDLNMPGANGLEVAKAFLEQSPSLRVCLISGDLNEAIVASARAAGIDNVVRKPGTLDEMSTVVRNLIAETV